MIHSSILQHFFPNHVVSSIASFGTGHINDTYKVVLEHSTAPYILQRINTEIFKQPQAIMSNIHQIAQHLQQKLDYPLVILNAVAASDGTTLFELEGNYWRVFPFLEATIAYEILTNPTQAYEAARGFGYFTKYLLDLPTNCIKTTLPNFKNHPLRLEQFENARLEDKKNRKKDCLEEITFIETHRVWVQQLSAIEAALPYRIVHLDTKLNNVLMDAHTLRAKAVIDLDTVMEGRIFDDFGDMVRTSCNPCAEDEPDVSKIIFDNTIYTALRAGYLEILENALTATEIDTLELGIKVVILIQATRFLTDYLEGDTYYKTTSANHNLVRARGQIALLKTIPF
jgi:Ser/Thr protein kinase RdoA (MazF antagonist)